MWGLRLRVSGGGETPMQGGVVRWRDAHKGQGVKVEECPCGGGSLRWMPMQGRVVEVEGGPCGGRPMWGRVIKVEGGPRGAG